MIEELTTREKEIAALVARGLTNRAVAKELGVVEGTVKVHLHIIFTKLGVYNRTTLALAMIARQQEGRAKTEGGQA